MYEMIFSRKAAKFISTLPHNYKNKIKEMLIILRENPYAYPYKKIRGKTNLYRLRMGNYRILYEVNKKQNQIIILNVDKRERIYKRK